MAPIAPEEKAQCAELHRREYPDRDDAAQRRQFNKLVKKSKNIPTGDPNMPEDLEMARRANKAIAERCNLGQDDDDDEDDGLEIPHDDDDDDDDDDRSSGSSILQGDAQRQQYEQQQRSNFRRPEESPLGRGSSILHARNCDNVCHIF